MLHPNDRIYERKEPEDPVNSVEYLKQILDRYHIDPDKPERQLISHWKDIAGSGVGNISECAGCNNGIIELVCAHPAQIQLIKMNKREVIKTVNSVFPELGIKDIKVSLKKH